MKTYTVIAKWDSGRMNGEFTRTGQTIEQVEAIQAQLRNDAPMGSTHSVKVIGE